MPTFLLQLQYPAITKSVITDSTTGCLPALVKLRHVSTSVTLAFYSGRCL